MTRYLTRLKEAGLIVRSSELYWASNKERQTPETRFSSLSKLLFHGNAPSSSGATFGLSQQFLPRVYYLPGTTGWSSRFDSAVTAPWVLPYPVILTISLSFGLQNNAFGFVISWTTNVPVVVEASTNLTNPNWSAVSTNILIDCSSYFSDPQWTNSPNRFYCVRSM